MELWKDIPGYEGRYQVSDLGRVRSLPFMQRYLLRNGAEAFRRTRERVLATQLQNGGYPIVHLHRNNQRRAFTVHGLVARAFVSNPGALPEVNHINGVKTDARACNLEWTTSSGNKIHAAATGLNSQAIPTVVDGVRFPSQASAQRARRLA